MMILYSVGAFQWQTQSFIIQISVHYFHLPQFNIMYGAKDSKRWPHATCPASKSS